MEIQDGGEWREFTGEDNVERINGHAQRSSLHALLIEEIRTQLLERESRTYMQKVLEL